MRPIPKFVASVLLASLVIGLIALSGCGSDTAAPGGPEATVNGQSGQPQVIQNLTAQQAFTLIEKNRNNPQFVVLDVRTAEEFNAGHLENATMLDYYSPTFRNDLDKLDKGKKYLVYCRSGHRGREAAKIMQQLGFIEVYNLADGIIGWEGAALPVVR